MLIFFSCCRKYILCWALAMMELMFTFHLRSWVMIYPKKWKYSTMPTRELSRVMGEDPL